MNIEFYSHGACEEVTGSKHFLRIGERILQIDCGMFQGKREETYQRNSIFPYKANQVNAVLLTHAHYDHSGALPILVKNGFQGNIYSTSATRDVSQIILLDSAFIQQKDFEYLTEKAEKHPDRNLKIYQPLYSSGEAIATMANFITVNYHRSFFPLPDVEATFFNAGHILGSAMVHLNIEKAIAIGFSGDLGRKNLPIIPDPEILPPLDYLVLEGTYGNRLHDPITEATQELLDIIHRAHSRNGKVIIPAFTIERTQELVYLIHTMQRENSIPPLPIYIDSPMAVNATSIFKIHPECFDQETIDLITNNHIDPFGFDSIHYTISTRDSMAINMVEGPAIIISASGMAESGRILHHLAHHIENPANIIAIVGFMAQYTLGRKLVEREPQVKILGKMYRVKAEIATLNAFSGHADHQEIIDWLEQHDLSRLKKIFLVHGELDALKNLQQLLAKRSLPPCEIVRYNQTYSLT